MRSLVIMRKSSIRRITSTSPGCESSSAVCDSSLAFCDRLFSWCVALCDIVSLAYGTPSTVRDALVDGRITEVPFCDITPEFCDITLAVCDTTPAACDTVVNLGDAPIIGGTHLSCGTVPFDAVCDTSAQSRVSIFDLLDAMLFCGTKIRCPFHARDRFRATGAFIAVLLLVASQLVWGMEPRFRL